jgi:glycosyltransferase involved in cell wall biosynthesis
VAQPIREGVASYVVDLVAGQAAQGWDVVLATPPADDLAARCVAVGARHVEWPAGRGVGPGVPAEVVRLRRVIRRADPDVVHLHSSKAGLAGRLALRGRRPTIFTPHAWSFLHGNAATKRGALAWERFASRWTTVVMCCSAGERVRGERAGVRAEMTVVLTGIDLRQFPPANAAERAQARRSLGLGPEPLALCVARLAPQKGQDLLLDAWPSVRTHVADAQLALVGDGPLRNDLSARGVPGVTLFGDRDDVVHWYAAADVVVAPSRWEGLSLVVLEALASARCVVATDVDGMRDAIGDDAGAIVDAGDTQAFAEAVARRLGDPSLAQEEGARARSRAEGFDRSAWLDGVVSLTRRVSEAGAGS